MDVRTSPKALPKDICQADSHNGNNTVPKLPDFHLTYSKNRGNPGCVSNNKTWKFLHKILGCGDLYQHRSETYDFRDWSLFIPRGWGSGGIHGGSIFVVYQVWGEALYFLLLFKCSFQKSKTKNYASKNKTAEKYARIHQIAPIFQFFPRGAYSWQRPTPLAPLKFDVHTFNI